MGPATACLAVDLERRDYLLQLLSSLLPPPNATFIKGTGDIGSVSPSSRSGCLGVKVAPKSTDTEQNPSKISRRERRVFYTIFLATAILCVMLLHLLNSDTHSGNDQEKSGGSDPNQWSCCSRQLCVWHEKT